MPDDGREAVLAAIGVREIAAMLLGDLNTTDAEPLMKQFLTTPGVIDAVGPAVLPGSKHVDWIFLHGLHTIGAGMKPRGVSDHPFFWADVLVD